MKEIWKDIVGYEGLFEISSEKRVRKIKTGKIMKPMKVSDTFNTVVVRLSKDGDIRRISVDKLYNQAFGEPIKNLEGEVWKNICEIEGFEDFIDYQISNMGRVKSLRSGYEKLMKPNDNGYGYLKFVLNIDEKHKTVQVHRLVAFAFIPNDDPVNKNEVNHINEIKTDNRAENLEWCDRSYNVCYGDCRKNAIKTRRENGTFNERKVYCEELDRVFPSIQAISEEFGYDYGNIWCCLNNYRNQQTAYGMHFHYYEDYFKDEN